MTCLRLLVASMQTATGSQETQTDTATSTKHVADPAEADETSTGPTAAGASEPSADAPPTEPVKPTVRRASPRTVVRDSLGVGEQLSDLPRRGNGSRSTTRTAAARDGAATAGSPSSASSSAASPSKGGNSSGGDSPGGDADDS